jgi:hypothetical protein
MANIELQDLTAIIHGTSMYITDPVKQFDLVHVETILKVNEVLPDTANWYVPNGSSIPPEIADFFKARNISMYPMSEEAILKGTEDVFTQAKSNNVNETEIDVSMILLRSVMTKSNLSIVTDADKVYHIAYDYKLYPIKSNPKTYEFKAQLPFNGLTIPAGGNAKVKMTVILPLDAKVNSDATQGTVVGGQTIQELMTPITNVGRQVISFEYHNDPDFIIQYHH